MGTIIATYVFAACALAALGGWAWFLVRISMARLEEAKSWEILERVESRIDARVSETVSIYLKRMAQKNAAAAAIAPDTATGSVLDDAGEAQREARRLQTQLRIFNEPVSEGPSPLPEMPLPTEG